MSELFDVLIIGAGPTGLACAIESQKHEPQMTRIARMQSRIKDDQGAEPHPRNPRHPRLMFPRKFVPQSNWP